MGEPVSEMYPNSRPNSSGVAICLPRGTGPRATVAGSWNVGRGTEGIVCFGRLGIGNFKMHYRRIMIQTYLLGGVGPVTSRSEVGGPRRVIGIKAGWKGLNECINLQQDLLRGWFKEKDGDAHINRACPDFRCQLQYSNQYCWCQKR